MLVLTIRFELIVILDRELPAKALVKIPGVHFGRVFAGWERVHESMQLTAPSKGQHHLQLVCNCPNVTCTDEVGHE